MIFITGATGLLGSFLAKEFIRTGHKVKAMKRESSSFQLLGEDAQKIIWEDGDLSDITVLEKIIEGVDTIVHSAALVSYQPQDKELLFEVNAQGTANLVNAALNKGISKFIHISSIAAIGRSKNESRVTEASVWEDSPVNSNYGKSKYLAELEVWRAFEEGLNGFIVNPSIILGPGDWNTGSSQLFKYVWKNNLFYSEKEMNYIDVRDVTQIVICLHSRNITGERFILNAGTTTYKHFFDMVAEKFGKRKPPYKVTKFIGNIAWRFEYLRYKLTGSKPLITKETAGISKSDVIYSNEKIKNLLNYSFIPFEETVSWTCEQLLQKVEK
ncbi:SDR family NAD(P)-dependent oxidoreductase [Sporocytophaga myxococcoides]|uniref:SDR family NAD(P)-dependent oxidoreductase n=1 Tax=Sporocytophaga myxococcoides TaxID=153721 RepID=UPI00041D8586|nr:SDR family NAD(P)-dependent oxidoreductase [Sporocytophaga myxococcoides]